MRYIAKKKRGKDSKNVYIYIVKIFSFNNSVKIQFSKNVLSNGIKFNLNTILEYNQRKKGKKKDAEQKVFIENDATTLKRLSRL